MGTSRSVHSESSQPAASRERAAGGLPLAALSHSLAERRKQAGPVAFPTLSRNGASPVPLLGPAKEAVTRDVSTVA